MLAIVANPIFFSPRKKQLVTVDHWRNTDTNNVFTIA